jgi:DNA-binding beta-propeller fold protein YncE
MGHKPKSMRRGRDRLLRGRTLGLLTAILVCAGITYGAQQRGYLRLGRQPDGSFIVSTVQRIEPGSIPFFGRPIDMALHPSGVMAVLDHHSVVLISQNRILSVFPLRHSAGFRGTLWSPDGKRLYVSMAEGYVQEMEYAGGKLAFGRRIEVKPEGAKRNPRPGGMAITRSGARLFVAVADRNAVVEINLTSGRLAREYSVQNLPFEVKLTADERTLIVTNWGGREATDDDDQATSGNAVIVVDPHGASASGTVSLIRRESGTVKRIDVGLHPTAIAVQGDSAYITNAASDSLTEIDLVDQRVRRTLPIKWGNMRLFGSMPCALAVRNGTAYICNGGDNAVCEMDLESGRVRGFRPAGYYPLAIALTSDGKRAFVLNTKGNGSVIRTMRGWAGSAHDFQGTVTTLDLNADLTAATGRVAANNGWNRDRSALRPRLAVYNGAIKHVLYIIKENRSYDEILGDMPQGNGDSRLSFLGENVTPNHHAIARQFTLFDNAYVSGTNSADGHQWSTQALANDYLEHFYTGYRTYSFDGTCPMSISSAGCLWDAALKKGRSIRDYGEFCDAKMATFTPPVKTWLDVWKDRVSGRRAIETRAGTRIESLKPYIHRKVLCWPLLQSDQDRADLFIADYNRLSKSRRVPNLMFLSLPCDHTEGRNPGFPKPQSMVADNDLALGRVVEAVTKSPEWKNTCIFVIEDDAQFGLDHVDGHRTIYFALSPYTRRSWVSHELCNTVSMIRSIELMLGLDPMNRFDALTPPLAECFTDTPDLTTYTAVPNRIPLDSMNPPATALKGQELYWTKRSLALDWSDLDRADPKTLNQIIWHTVQGMKTPYPGL